MVKEPFISKYKFPLWFTGITLLIVLLDQLIKYFILTLTPNWNLEILLIHLVKNTGAGFGIFQNQALFLGIISALAAILILFNYQKIDKNYRTQILFAVLLGGVLGNMIDRFFRSFVIDFIDFGWWPAFNLADACISVSIIGLVIWYWKKK
ncbi:MAG: signal peptidase II [Candidatus Woesearchaeota archaeon]